MAEGRGLLKRFRSKSKKRKKDRFRDLRNAYRGIENQKKYLRTILFPLIMLGILVVFIPSILGLFGLPVVTGQIQFSLIGTIPMILGVLYPYISWKNKEGETKFSCPSLAATSYLTRLGYIKTDGVKTVYGKDLMIADQVLNLLPSSYIPVENNAQSILEATFKDAVARVSWFFY